MVEWLEQKECNNFFTIKNIWQLEGGFRIEPAHLAAENAEHSTAMGLPDGIDGLSNEILIDFAKKHFESKITAEVDARDDLDLNCYKQLDSWCNGGNTASLFSQQVDSAPEWGEMMNLLDWYGAKQTKLTLGPITMPLPTKEPSSKARTIAGATIQKILEKRERKKPSTKLKIQ
jgi:hypothetical protein